MKFVVFIVIVGTIMVYDKANGAQQNVTSAGGVNTGGSQTGGGGNQTGVGGSQTGGSQTGGGGIQTGGSQTGGGGSQTGGGSNQPGGGNKGSGDMIRVNLFGIMMCTLIAAGLRFIPI